MPPQAATLSAQQLEDLQNLLRDWLRQSGRTQADLRRALRAGSIRMPVLIEELHRTWSHQGAAGLAERLCDIEARWLSEDPEAREDRRRFDDDLDASMSQLDLLLQDIRGHGDS